MADTGFGMRLLKVNDGVASVVAVSGMDEMVNVGSKRRVSVAVWVGSNLGIGTVAGMAVEMDVPVEIKAGISIGAGSPHDDSNKITKLGMVQWRRWDGII